LANKKELSECRALNVSVQAFLREWSAVSERRNLAVMLDQAAVPWLAEMNRGLNDVLDDAAFRARLHQSHRQLRVLAQEILDRGVSEHPELGTLKRRILASTAVPTLQDWKAMLPAAA
jgi:hypothetical protein